MGQTTDERWMLEALELAASSMSHGDVPIGAVVIRGGRIVGSGGNRREADRDPTAHAETLALREAAASLDTWRLEGCELYVTLEPCAMCAGAIVLSRIDRVVFGALDPKAGFAGSLGNLVQDERLNHRVELVGGILADEAAGLLQAFFRERR